MAGAVPARVNVDKQGLVTPQAEKEQEDSLWFARGWPLPGLRPLYILSSLPGAKHGTGTHGGHSCLQGMGHWLRPGAQPGTSGAEATSE